MEIGERLPEVLGVNEAGEEVRLSAFAGKKFILYFYPKDSTPGCTAEACSLRDNYAALQGLGYEVLGVSIDSVASHQRFIEKQQLPFHLIADTEKTLVEAMGVWGEKKMCGRTYMGTLRTTFLVDENGCVARVFTPKEIKTKTHADQILSEVQ